jgi:hypothetical protein
VAVYRKEAPGPFAASLLFRVGAADEELSTRVPRHGLSVVLLSVEIMTTAQPER